MAFTYFEKVWEPITTNQFTPTTCDEQNNTKNFESSAAAAAAASLPAAFIRLDAHVSWAVSR